MMGLIKSLAGTVRIEIISADPAEILAQVNQLGIPVFDVRYIDALTVQGSVFRQNIKEVIQLVDRKGVQLKEIRKQGLFWTIMRTFRRPVFLIGMAIFLLLALFLPSRIFFVRVEGNASIPTRLILEKAENCGIAFGASRREVRSEKMKNALLSEIPELQWAGVNTYGCVAVISVREKTVTEENVEGSRVSSIVASRDGIIRECTVRQGNALCRIGQAVKAGQTLVSGYTDCGLSIKATRAEAEIYAETLHDLVVLTPVVTVSRGNVIREETRYSLLVGKKLINFYQDSGIWDTTCVKMYEEDYLTLPGGFQLPIALVRETWIYYDIQNTAQTEADAFSWMQTAAGEYLQSIMIAGQILEENVSLQMQDGVCCLTGQYACLEMIGKVKNEEILQYDAENN